MSAEDSPLVLSTPAPRASEPFGVLAEIVAGRHSCRAFTATPVSLPLIEDIVRLAGRTPSGCNAQPWQVVITRGAATDKFRSALMQEETRHPGGAPDYDWPLAFGGVYRSRRRECGAQLYASVGIGIGCREDADRQAFENFRLFGAPHVAIVSIDADLGTYGAVDGGAFVTGFMLAAQSLGIATVPQAALALHAAFTREWFGLGDDRKILCGISFGYPDRTHPVNGFRTTRAPLSEILTMHE